MKQQIGILKQTLPRLDEANGIQLIESIRAHFGGTPRFPIYAYISKGPYLLQNEGFDRLENLNARWLFKGKYSALSERNRIVSDIGEFRDRFSWPKRFWQIAITTGLLSAVLGIGLDRILRHLGL